MRPSPNAVQELTMLSHFFIADLQSLVGSASSLRTIRGTALPGGVFGLKIAIPHRAEARCHEKFSSSSRTIFSGYDQWSTRLFLDNRGGSPGWPHQKNRGFRPRLSRNFTR